MKGITLIEIVLYTAIAGMVLYGVSILFGAAIISDARNEARSEVDASAAHALVALTQAIRSNGSADAWVEDGTLYMREGEIEETLTPPSVFVGTFVQTASTNATSSTVRIELEAHYRNAGRPEQQYSNTWYASATTR